MIKTEKQYLGKEEAFEITCIEWGNDKLPKKGIEHLRVGHRLQPTEVIGKDSQGFYYCEYE